MPRTIESIMAAHTAATERRRTGRPVWDEHVRIKGYLNNDSLPFEEMRDAIVAKIKASRWFRNENVSESLRFAVEALEESQGEDDFNQALGEAYDCADEDRVWLG